MRRKRNIRPSRKKIKMDVYLPERQMAALREMSIENHVPIKRLLQRAVDLAIGKYLKPQKKPPQRRYQAPTLTSQSAD
jgi:hypothetical protein